MERMDQAVDKIRKKFGKNAIMRASFLDNPKVEHMTGGHPDGGQVDLKKLKDHKGQRPRCKHTGHQTSSDASIGVLDPRGSQPNGHASMSAWLVARRNKKLPHET